MHPSNQTNALAGETSPYLLQHAHNPVAWYPWGPEALERARREDRPILLSIGYSACHWCHVMAHESFEDPETAALMNRLFVNIKVDREERPDLDKIYQAAHHLLAQRAGGWPLTMFLTPDDHAPFFGGTYFPKEARYGLPSFKQLLTRVAELHTQRRADIRAQNSSLVQALESMEPTGGGPEQLSPAPLDTAARQLEQAFDENHGGFGRAPKFPHPNNIERLLRRHAASHATGTPDARALRMATRSLTRMAMGGIYDQVGGGFCRYSVDDYWMIPHFEKMLYDNGPLLSLYAEAWQLTADPLFARTAAGTAGWVMREMQGPDGGYYSSLDADSEGHEGKFYLWDPAAVRALVSPEEYAVIARRFGLDREANFEGLWHLHGYVDDATVAATLGLTEAQVVARSATGLAKLLAAREERVRPGRDDKVLGSWNGLMIKGMATAGRILGQPEWVRSAERALDFVRSTLWQDGRLLATAKDGRAHLPAYLDDYAFLLDGILALLTARWRTPDVRFAVELAEVLLRQFEDSAGGGFFFTAHDHETLIHRPKPLADEAIPAGNGVAARALGRLGHLLGEHRYTEAAERTLRAAWPAIVRLPYAHNSLLDALEEVLEPPRTIILRGHGPELAAWQERCQRDYAPRRLSLAIPEEETELPGPLAARQPRGAVTAYLCEGATCRPPITNFQALDEALARGEVPRGDAESNSRSPSP